MRSRRRSGTWMWVLLLTLLLTGCGEGASAPEAGRDPPPETEQGEPEERAPETPADPNALTAEEIESNRISMEEYLEAAARYRKERETR